jgi:hypothetical protein
MWWQQCAAGRYPEARGSIPHHLPYYFLQTHFRVTLPSAPKSSQWSLSFRFYHKNFVCISLFSHLPPSQQYVNKRLGGPQSYSGRFGKEINSLYFAINLLKPTSHVMHQQFNIQQQYALLTLYLCVLYLSEIKQRLVPLTA